MLEERKRKEAEHYDKQADAVGGASGDFEGFDPSALSSYRFLYDWLGKHCRDKKVLDYGCGNGVHLLYPAKMGAEKVTGVDLSAKSLEIAKNRVKKAGLEKKIELLMMDCEKMDFSDDEFDVILDGGTFSSLDLEKAFAELARILKPGGFLIGVETLGHNPFTNLKREINRMTGKRTGWAVNHILRMEDFEKAKKYFSDIEVNYFHLVSWAVFPFLKLPGGILLMRIFEFIDNIFLSAPFLRKYAFKTVFVFSSPKK